MKGEKISILLIEDNPGDARLIRELLSAKEGASFFLEHADRLSTGLARLAQGNIDVILLDLSLPDSHGLEGLNKICAQAPKVPVVVLSGLSDEAVAINAVQEGTQDYLVKGSVDSALLMRSLRYAIERQHLRVALRESESHYRLLADNAADVIWTANMKWKITYVSPSIKRLLGYTVEEMMRLAITDILTPDSLKQASKFIRNQMDIMTPGSQHPSLSLTLEYVRKDGSTLWAEVMLSFLWDKDGKLSGVLGVTREITERKKAEEALRQSEQRYRLLAENVKDVIWIRDMNLKLTYTSPSVLEMSGYSVEEVMSMSLEESLTPASLELIRPVLDKVLAAAEKGQGDLPEVIVLDVELIRKDGSITPVEMKVNLLRDSAGHPTGYLGVTRDITERKKAEEALRQSEQRYRLLAENVKDVIWTVDMNLRLTYTSPSITQLTGYRHEEYITKTLEEILTPASVEFVTNLFAEELALDDSGHSDLFRARTFEAELICKDGSTVPVEMKATALRDADGQPIGVLGVSRDISERKRAEEALRESQEELQAIFDNARDGIALFDLKGRLLKANKRVFEVGGYTMDEIAGKTFDLLKMFTPESIELMFTAKDMISSGKEVPVFECEACTKSGRKLNLEIHVSPFFLKGKRLGSVSIMRDITERKKAGDALRASEAQYRLLAENVKDVISVIDMNLRLTYVSPSVTHLLGYSVEEAMALTLEEGLTTASYEKLMRAFAEGMAAEKKGDGSLPTSLVLEVEAKHKDGHLVPVEMMANLLRDAEGKPVGILGVTRDITERKKMDEELRRLSDAVKMSTDSIVITDLEGNIVDVNEATLKIQRASSKSDLIGLKSSDFIAPEEQEEALWDLSRLMEEGHANDIQYHILTRDGRRVLVETNASIMKGISGEAIGVVAVTRDVTERRKMEEELRLLSDAVKMSNDSIVISDLEGRIIEANEATVKMHGMDNREDLIGRLALELIAPEDHEMLTEKMTKGMVSGRLTCLEYHCVTKDGRKLLVEANVSVMQGRNGEHTGFMAVVRDITERKQMEEALRQSEHNYKVLFKSTIDGMFVTDIETVKIVLANQNAAKMCGFASAENAIGINPLDLVHPDDKEQVLGFLMGDALGESEQEVHEFRAITKDGREIWVSGMGTRIEYGGKPAVLSSIRDITERKKAEEVLRISEERYRLLVENASEAILVAQDGMLRFFNTRVIEILGYSREELASKPFIEFIHSEDQAMVVGRHMARLEGKEVPPVYSFRVVDKTGNVRWVDISAVAFTWEGRPATLNFLTDITERKKAEEEKQRMEEQLLLASRLAAVGELSAGVAHELNNPITAIQGFAQFLTARKDLDTIYRESQRAAKITQNLLSFARRHEPEKHLISLNEAVEKTLELQAHPMKVNNIELVVELAPDLPKTLADFHQMQQVFVNIINNAEQAMVEAHGKGRLVVKT